MNSFCFRCNLFFCVNVYSYLTFTGPNMSDSECSDIDVCSIDEATAINLHTGLTLVAAETYIPSESTSPRGLLHKLHIFYCLYRK